jgi:hypothetical protein
MREPHDSRQAPDVVLLAANWRTRALLRAQLIEEGLEVCAVDGWPGMIAQFQSVGLPWVAVVDLQSLPEPVRVLEELQKLMDPRRVIVLAAAGTVPPDRVQRWSFRVIRRPFRIGQVVAAAMQIVRAEKRRLRSAARLRDRRSR